MACKYIGMTVNERLYVSGLIYEFDQQVKEKNIQNIIKILNKVELDEDSVNLILKSLRLIE